MIDSVNSPVRSGMMSGSGSSLAAISAAAAAAAAVASSNHHHHDNVITMPTQKTPFAIQELLGLTAAGSVEAKSAASVASAVAVATSSAAAMAGANFPPISCYNSSFFNSSAVADQYNQHQRMFYNSAGLFGNLHHQSQSFASSSAAAASHLLDSTLRAGDQLSSKKYQVVFSCSPVVVHTIYYRILHRAI